MAKVTSEQFIELVGKSKLADERRRSPPSPSASWRTRRADCPPTRSKPARPSRRPSSSPAGTARSCCRASTAGSSRQAQAVGHLGTGGMSTVYLAEHTIMRHRRAVKVMPRSKLGNNSYLRRFQQEAKAIAGLNHPNIVRAYDVDNENDTHYIVMEYVEGRRHPEHRQEERATALRQGRRIHRAGRRGLQHADGRGLIHRDVKPANMLVNREDMVKVLDLGLALYADDEASSLTIEHNDKVLGTADYSAPSRRSTAIRSTTARTSTRWAAACTTCSPAAPIPRGEHRTADRQASEGDARRYPQVPPRLPRRAGRHLREDDAEGPAVPLPGLPKRRRHAAEVARRLPRVGPCFPHRASPLAAALADPPRRQQRGRFELEKLDRRIAACGWARSSRSRPATPACCGTSLPPAAASSIARST